MSECLRDFNKRMDAWQEKVKAVYAQLHRAHAFYNIGVLDVLFLGVVTACKTYNWGSDYYPYLVSCGDATVDIGLFKFYRPTERLSYKNPELYKMLMDVYNSSRSSAQEPGDERKLREDRFYIGLGYLLIPEQHRYTDISIYYPKDKVLPLAKKLSVAVSDVEMVVYFKSSKFYALIGHCKLTYAEDVGLLISSECPRTQDFCNVVNALFEVVDSSINVFKEIVEKGINILTTYLLY
jgi:hypothetical protein